MWSHRRRPGDIPKICLGLIGFSICAYVVYDAVDQAPLWQEIVVSVAFGLMSARLAVLMYIDGRISDRKRTRLDQEIRQLKQKLRGK